MIYDSMGNYTLAFLLAGCPPIIGALLMCFIYCVKDEAEPKEEPGTSEKLLTENGEAAGRQSMPNVVTSTTIVADA